jgi:hypothetical protein
MTLISVPTDVVEGQLLLKIVRPWDYKIFSVYLDHQYGRRQQHRIPLFPYVYILMSTVRAHTHTPSVSA